MDYVVIFTAVGTRETAMLPPPATVPKSKKNLIKKIGSRILKDPLVLLSPLTSLFSYFFAT